AMAERLRQSPDIADAPLIDAAFRLTFGRLPTDAERARAGKFLQKLPGTAETPVAQATSFRSEKMPYREGRAAVLQADSPQVRFQVPKLSPALDGDFTVEAFVLLRSLYDDASVRTIISKGRGRKTGPGWSLGVTGRKSAFKPQTLVLQLMGDSAKHGTDSENIFSGLHIALNKPYFVAVSVSLGDADKKGITFYAKDLSNDDEPMQSVHSSHQPTGRAAPEAVFTIGGRDLAKPDHNWDGLIDDVRLSRGVLRAEQLLLTAEGVTDRTVGYWQFETK